MNRRLIVRLQGAMLVLEAVLMIPALVLSLCYGEGDAHAFLKSMGVLLVLGLPMWFLAKPTSGSLRQREGLVSVALSWILLSAFGALPYLFSGVIPDISNAVFESASGFTTTGATILRVPEALPRGILLWRSFTLWIGGMGVLVLTLALLPQMTERSSYLIRAESPGPSLSKLVPRMGDMAKILYMIYTALTVLQTLALMAAGLSPFDAVIHAMGTAGTGGFSNYAASMGHFQNVWVEGISTAFMVLFGINFAVFYYVIRGSWRDALKSEELRWYALALVAAALACALLILPQYGNWWTALRHGAFQVASTLSTTGYATQDIDQWHQGAKMILFVLMLVGACGGSTTGGMKMVRMVLLIKIARREIQRVFRPRKIQAVRFEGKAVDDHAIGQVLVFFFLFMAMAAVGAFVLSLENHFTFEFNLTTAIASISNGGAGFGVVDPAVSLADYEWGSKLTLVFLMLLGRLEIFPMLVLFHPSIWKK